MAKPIILYDGNCVLCTRSVRFMQAHQHPGALEYATQQSERGKLELKTCGLDKRRLDMLVFVEDGHCYLRSTAALRAFRYLRFPWPLLYVFIFAPKSLRDPVYNLIAHNRYRWFGHMPRE
jgi:predicted DCC family thiol-disulfide oxidoreductase YuxK